MKSRRHNDLAILLQKIESKVIVQRGTRDFNRKHPAAPIFTIHDCVLTIPEYVELLKEEIENQLLNVVGAKPTMTLNELNPVMD